MSGEKWEEQACLYLFSLTVVRQSFAPGPRQKLKVEAWLMKPFPNRLRVCYVITQDYGKDTFKENFPPLVKIHLSHTPFLVG
jgi:hypothetical protein